MQASGRGALACRHVPRRLCSSSLGQIPLVLRVPHGLSVRKPEVGRVSSYLINFSCVRCFDEVSHRARFATMPCVNAPCPRLHDMEAPTREWYRCALCYDWRDDHVSIDALSPHLRLGTAPSWVANAGATHQITNWRPRPNTCVMPLSAVSVRSTSHPIWGMGREAWGWVAHLTCLEHS